MTERRRRCQAVVYKRDCYRVDSRAPGGFSMHYNREQCKRPSLPSTNVITLFCWQHSKIANTPGAAYPQTAGYWEYMDEKVKQK